MFGKLRKWNRYHFWHVVYEMEGRKGYRTMHSTGNPVQVSRHVQKEVEAERGQPAIITSIQLIK